MKKRIVWMIGAIAMMTKIAVIHHATIIYVDQIKVSSNKNTFPLINFSLNGIIFSYPQETEWTSGL